MRFKFATLAPLALATFVASSASAVSVQIEEQWLFSEANDTEMRDARSNLNNRFSPNIATPGASVQDGQLEFLNSQNYFLNNAFTDGNRDSGLYTLSWDYTDVDMSNSTFGLVGFEIRDPVAGTAFATLRLRVLEGDLVLQHAAGDTNTAFSTIGTFAGLTLADLNITTTIDLDNAGSAGSFTVEYTLGGGTTQLALDDGVAAQFGGYKILQQFSDTGGSDAADYFRIDNFTLTAVPEPSTYALLLGGVIALFVVARRR